jgi:HSP20 family molecular chaperone IbpA
MTGVTTFFPRSTFVGFDHLFNELEHVARHAKDNYPPHNVLKTGESLEMSSLSKLKIEL